MRVRRVGAARRRIEGIGLRCMRRGSVHRLGSARMGFVGEGMSGGAARLSYEGSSPAGLRLLLQGGVNGDLCYSAGGQQE